MTVEQQWSVDQIPSLDGKNAIVTGGNSGLGYETVKVLANKGADVLMACRSAEKAEQALQQLKQEGVKCEKIQVGHLDLASLESVKKFATEDVANKHHFDKVDILVNNAGVMAFPKRIETKDGFEMQFGTNHLGHFALTSHLMPLILKSQKPRIVNVSSFLHTRAKVDFDNCNSEKSYSQWGSYAFSKLCNILFTKELARKFAEASKDVVVTACHPGYSATQLQSNTGIPQIGQKLSNALFAQSAEKGARPQLFAATSDLAESGQYFGPDGFQQLWGNNVKKEKPSADAENADYAKKLWELSEGLTKVQFSI
ncbi:hypothetical protein MIR68_009329 [Amoeboaphelidium protococcarum]|nr:hypothetical protein MIR68_009329 [Amoeboaphelidium protococcarum]